MTRAGSRRLGKRIGFWMLYISMFAVLVRFLHDLGAPLAVLLWIDLTAVFVWAGWTGGGRLAPWRPSPPRWFSLAPDWLIVDLVLTGLEFFVWMTFLYGFVFLAAVLAGVLLPDARPHDSTAAIVLGGFCFGASPFLLFFFATDSLSPGD